MTTDTVPFWKNRVPWRLKNAGQELQCEWLFTSNQKFTEPFFDDTIASCKGLPENIGLARTCTELNKMIEQSASVETLLPRAVIFHVSRCGSTLVSQLLCCDKRNLVLSEVPFLDELLRLPYQNQKVLPADVLTLFAAALRFYGQKKENKQDSLFLKTDSWHIHFYASYRKLFPQVPFILLYRDPLEVILSQQKQRGLQSVPGLLEWELFGFEQKREAGMNLDIYMAMVLSSYYREMIRVAETDPLVKLYNYADGVGDLVKEIYSLNGRIMEKEPEQLMNERIRFHAKYPQQLFTEEKPEKQVPAYLEKAFALYQQLEQLRISMPSAQLLYK